MGASLHKAPGSHACSYMHGRQGFNQNNQRTHNLEQGSAAMRRMGGAEGPSRLCHPTAPQAQPLTGWVDMWGRVVVATQTSKHGHIDAHHM